MTNQPSAPPPFGPPSVAPRPPTSFIPRPDPPRMPEISPATQYEASYASAGHDLLAKHHNVHGALDIQGRRLEDLLCAHAAVISHVVEQAERLLLPDDRPSFLTDIADAMKANQGALRKIEQDAQELLTQHAAVIAAVEQFL